jgi:membrane-bound lytic murein transglycosylase D
MTKKPLIACLAMLALLLMAKLLLFSNNNPLASPKQSSSKAYLDNPYLTSLSFANETLPVADEIVTIRIKRMLKTYSHRNLQTHKLHSFASRLFPVINPILEKYGIPEDFKYIPLVESGLKGGTSHKGASGLWQFMPETARGYGLIVNAGVDERHKVVKSTIAACKYLRSLYKEFNDWTLVAAAYNIGGNKLKRRIKQQNQDNYYRMKLNPETAIYVYKLVAMKEIIEHPELYGYRKAVAPVLAINIQDSRYYPDYFLKGLNSNIQTQLD